MQTLYVMFTFSRFLHADALVIVKEVANHANDIMKQGVRANEKSGI